MLLALAEAQHVEVRQSAAKGRYAGRREMSPSSHDNGDKTKIRLKECAGAGRGKLIWRRLLDPFPR